MRPQSPGIAYRLLSLVLLPFWLLHALQHGRKFKVPDYFRLRNGIKGKPLQRQIWVHASSVGEVESISPLVKSLLDQGETILFTSFTATGYTTIKSNFSERVESSIIPIDFAWHCWRFFRQHSIKCCVLMETELWPELLFQAANKNIPIIQVNARLSDKSLKAPIFIRSLLRRTLAYVTLHLTRNENDKTNLQALGALSENIEIIGNLKSNPGVLNETARLIDRPYLLMASTHADEEIELLQQRPEEFRQTLIVIAPRHPQRSKDIQQQIGQLGIHYSVRSLGQSISQETEVYLADTLGELKQFMKHAQVVIMGGSFDQTGGHNLIEPASLGCAIITGPSDSNIRQDIELLGRNRGVLQVTNIAECWKKTGDLIKNKELTESLGENARESIQQQPDIVQAYLAELMPYLSQSARDNLN